MRHFQGGKLNIHVVMIHIQWSCGCLVFKVTLADVLPFDGLEEITEISVETHCQLMITFLNYESILLCSNHVVAPKM